MKYTEKVLKLYQLNHIESNLVKECITKLLNAQMMNPNAKLHIERLEVCVIDLDTILYFHKPIRMIDRICLKTNKGFIDIKFDKNSDLTISNFDDLDLYPSKENKTPIIDILEILLEECKFGDGLTILVNVEWIDKPRINMNKLCYPLVDSAYVLHQLQYRTK